MDNRRSFIKKVSLGGIAAGVAGKSWASVHPSADEPAQSLQVLPDPLQKAWMDLKFGMFVHFGINTYYDAEWSDGTLDPSKFNPEKLDTDQWCKTAKAAGMKYIVLITKHHDGFCLWPTKYTDYSVKSTPYKKDIVAEVVNSANKYGLKVGLYYSLWDRHEKLHDQNEWLYVDFMKNQLNELLTGYGPVVELWFDGFWKKQQHGWTKKIDDEAGENIERGGEASLQRNLNFIQAWRNEGAYRWQMDHLYQYIKSLQPDCLVMNNSTTAYPGVPLHPVDIRSGEKYTEVKEDQKVWEWMGKPLYLPIQIETTMSVKGNKQFPSGNWFWHEWDNSVLPKEKILKYLEVAGKMKANLLLNVGPDPKGKLRPQDEATLSNLMG
jgi:alpha-L-fucosidase